MTKCLSERLLHAHNHQCLKRWTLFWDLPEPKHFLNWEFNWWIFFFSLIFLNGTELPPPPYMLGLKPKIQWTKFNKALADAEGRSGFNIRRHILIKTVGNTRPNWCLSLFNMGIRMDSIDDYILKTLWDLLFVCLFLTCILDHVQFLLCFPSGGLTLFLLIDLPYGNLKIRQ